VTVSIDVAATRTAATSMHAVVAAMEQARRDVVGAADLAALASEHQHAITLIDELRDEVGLTAQVMGLTADHAEAADASYASMLNGWLWSNVTALSAGINDGAGTSVLSLIRGAAGAIPPAYAASLTPAAADAWLRSLPAEERVAVAAAADRFDGTAIGGAIDRWMATLEGEPLREIYVARAALTAGIDMDAWNPSLGLAPNAATVEAVYEYYAELYRSDTDRLWWSGMAALIGPSFYGGFQDLDTFRSMLGMIDAVAASPIGAGLPPGVRPVAELGSDAMSAELLWYQVRLLSMQKEIFIDMAAAHEAYLDGGIDTIERFYVNDPHGFGSQSIDAWRQIDNGWRTGDVDLVASGNATLLLREQQQVIADDYDRMRDRAVTGEAVTWAMTLVGAPSVPGASTYPQVFPLTVEIKPSVSTPKRVPVVPILGPFSPSVPIPHIEVEAGVVVETPLPNGNISNFDDRWALIEQDTLPTYVDLARNHPDRVVAVLDTPVGERAEAFTIDERIDDIVISLATDWDLDPELDVRVGW
jgi:hypothetical protein